MEVITIPKWIVYIGEKDDSRKKLKRGKWMYFFENKEFVAEICKKAIDEKIVSIAKHSDSENGVSCFYINGDDITAHKRVLEFFISNNLIERCANGRFHNISFKFDEQTRAGEYGDKFESKINLEQFIDLFTGEWKI